jgi:hypothetical protein
MKKIHAFFLLAILFVSVASFPYVLRSNQGNTTRIGDVSYVYASWGGMYISVLVSLLALVLAFVLLRQLNITHTYTSLILFVSSPLFMFSTSWITPVSIIMSVFFIAVIGLFSEKKILQTMGLIAAPVLGFFGVWHGVVLALLSFVVLMKKKSFFVFLMMSLSLISSFLFFTQLPTSLLGSGRIIDFGAVFGLSLFLLILFAIGFAVASPFPLYHWSALFIVIGMFFIPDLVIYATFVTCLYGGFAFSRLQKRVWSFETVGRLTLIVLGCGVLFGSIVVAVNFANLSPSPLMYDGFVFLSDQPAGVATSAVANTFFVTAISKKEFVHISELMSTREYFGVIDMLNAHDIEYILLTGNERALQNIFVQDSETFKRIFENTDIEIWLYKRRDI